MANPVGLIYTITEYACGCADCGASACIPAAANKQDAVFRLKRRGWHRGWDNHWRCPSCSQRYERAHAGESEANR